MFKFRRNEELVDQVNKQNEQIQRYESRLRDLVHAYKSLQNEKEALERGMKALTRSAPSSEKSKRTTGSSNSGSLTNVSSASNEDEVGAGGGEEKLEKTEVGAESSGAESRSEDEDESGGEEDDNVQHLRSQLMTLTTSLSTLSEEKAKVVAAYQAEKKKTNQEQEARLKQLRDETDALKVKLQLTEQELQATREKLTAEKRAREEEQTTHSIMLREIQRMLNDERGKKEHLDAAVKELRAAVKSAEKESKSSDELKLRFAQLERELTEANAKLKLAREEALKTPPQVVQLQQEQVELKEEYEQRLRAERARVEECERREKERERMGEERASGLEEKLVRISDKMGSVEGRRHHDQLAIQKLKDRVSQLEAENSVLTKQNDDEDEDVDVDDVEKLKQRVTRYHQLLRDAAARGGIELGDDLQFTTSSSAEENDYKEAYLANQKDLIDLKDEFERYKTRAQNVLKSRRGGKEEDETRKAVQEYKERNLHLRDRCDRLQHQLEQQAEEQARATERQAAAYDAKVGRVEERWKAKVAEMEREIKAQRERTVAILVDKDKEIKQLKAYTSTFQSEEMETATTTSLSRLHSSGTDAGEIAADSDPVNTILHKGSADTKLLHYVEQLARKDVAINSIRREKKLVELQLRHLQDDVITKEENHAREVTRLTDELGEKSRCSVRENANMEYLKNVFYRYLTSSDPGARDKMTVAIATILQFSPDERKKAKVKGSR